VPRPARVPRTARVATMVAAALAVVLYLGSGLWQAAHDAPTVDETVDLSSGVATLVRHDLRMNPEHPPLPKVLSALPALFAHPIVPESDAWRSGDWFGFADDFVRANEGAGRLDRVLFVARLVPLAEGLACGWLLFLLGRRLFGAGAGAAAGILWLTTPTVVGLAHFVSIDVAFTLATLVVAWCVLRFVERPVVANAAWLGAACAAALLTRHSALSLWAYAVIVVAACAWRVDRQLALRCAAMVLFVGFAGVWVGTRALAPTGSGDVFAARADSLVADASAKSVVARTALAVPFPSEYRAGLGYLVVTSDARPVYLFGHSWTGSRVWYFPAALLTKLPLGALAALVLAPFAMRSRARDARRRVLLAIVGPAVVSFGFLLAQPLNLGARYVLPSLALLLVPAGAAVGWLTTRPRRAFAGVALATQFAAMIGAGQHALAWTAPPFRPAYRWVSDSNLDYGQDNDRVAAWATQHPGAWVALLHPRGVDNPAATRELRGTDASVVDGWLAVSATRLTEIDRDELSWLRAYCPVDDIGGSVLLYRLAGAPDTRPGPTMPASPCAGAEYSTRG
jgi:4-amino-4-deoxy-L-arabinose transferase-like glycosyltransferase